jgi:hypothetical protein
MRLEVMSFPGSLHERPADADLGGQRARGPVRRPARRSLLRRHAKNFRDGWIAKRFGVEGFLIVDDTGFPKQGENSVGVARQYTGTLGKIASCQVAVTLQFATVREVLGLDAKLYLPWRASAPTGAVANARNPRAS